MDDFEKSMLFQKATRWTRAAPAADIIGTLTFVATAVGVATTLIATRVGATGTTVAWIVLAFSLLIGLALLTLLIIKTNLEYRYRTYDAANVMVFDHRWFTDLKRKRSNAAKLCLEYLRVNDWKLVKDASDVDYILDFLTDVGFYLKGGQFSDEVAHHHFFHWIRGWYTVLESYIHYFIETNNEEAPYKNIEFLFQRTTRVGQRYKKCKTTLNPDDLKKFLVEEIAEITLASQASEKG